MRRRAPRRPSTRDKVKATIDRKPWCLWNATTMCLCCLVIMMFLIQAYIGLYAQTVQRDMELEPFDNPAAETELSAVHPQANVPFKNETKHHRILPSSTLPAWIQNYLRWHQEQRAKYPGRSLFDDLNAPPLLIRTCLGLCGGLNDRLGQLPWDLFLANQTGRLLLLHWHRPLAVEEFLVPAELDWSVPRDVPGFFGNPRVSRRGMDAVRQIKELFEGYEQESGPEALFWESQFDAAMKRATQGEFQHFKVLRHRLLGHLDEDKLEERLRALGETDMLHHSPTYGNIFRMFFSLNPNVQRELDNVFSSLKIRPTLSVTDYYPHVERFSSFPVYSAVHCRVRHPKATPKNVMVKGKTADYPADKSGLPWEGETRDFAIETATHALQCAKTLLDPNNREPIYFFADSNDLVRFMSHELKDASFLRANETLLRNPTSAKALEVVQAMPVVARESAYTQENAHIDRQKGRDAPSYYATFVDLYVAIYARTVTFGIGNFAVLATRIAGSQGLLYQEESWGRSEKKQRAAPMCPLNSNNGHNT